MVCRPQELLLQRIMAPAETADGALTDWRKGAPMEGHANELSRCAPDARALLTHLRTASFPFSGQVPEIRRTLKQFFRHI